MSNLPHPQAETRTHSFTVAPEHAGQRLDRFLGDAMAEQRERDGHGDAVSREKVKRAIRDGAATVQGRACTVPNTRVEPGQTVTLTLAVPAAKVTPEDGDLAVLYRDAAIAVLDKPAGLTVHPCPSCPEGTLVHRLVRHFPELAAQEGFRPGIVHRIDKDTSGLLLVALTEAVRLELSRAFAERQVHKEYLALVHGVPKAQGELEAPIGRHPLHKVKMAVVPENRGGKPARSAWRVLLADPDGRFALVAVRIFTGRTHQIRVHMAHLGHPLWQDAVYGPSEAVPPAAGELPDFPSRQMLHAWRLSFRHPETDRDMHFTCPPPPDFAALALRLSRRMQRVVVTGSPGCGKSALVRQLGEAGLPVWSADAAVARLYEPGCGGHHLLRGRYGDRFVPDPAGPVDKRALFAAMQADAALRREVEDMIHPLARHDMDAFFAQAEASGAPVAVAEVPLFLEAGWKAGTQPNILPNILLVGVHCPFAERARRLETHRGWPPDMIAAMEAWQWPEADKMRACHLVVDNSGTPEDLTRRARGLLAELARLRAARDARAADHLASLWQA
ncbi:dephospho-CoA kinase [Nitratidesulfovibrio sp. SRB-5]|uniref:dephospho-CoA kinase n=1 Tax=Nitratidesulfovibrio sp. SRB-5 TaxID=2872636 RepID=UPI0010266350|nr:dephospho-CoA kinase [Nitratidesulfovibrio sp. SRB-5]MBZ2172772.1 dephospho-CoA kinase [Nitratidesulfovibrio sp. SRB-5]RXF75937.1 dephospho-CoA kinase [Desulfovibrio sp. DS-1]